MLSAEVHAMPRRQQLDGAELGSLQQTRTFPMARAVPLPGGGWEAPACGRAAAALCTSTCTCTCPVCAFPTSTRLLPLTVH